MRKIVAIGGGEIGRPGTQVETIPIDKEIIRLTGKRNPHVLFIPTASTDSEGYVDVVKQHFGGRLGCTVDVLYLLRQPDSAQAIKRKIANADIVYVGGGNTLKMMSAWRKHGVDKLLEKASAAGTVLSGVSAGAICWFKYGNSDSRKPYIRVKGTGMVGALFCPHYDAEIGRPASMKDMMQKTSGVGIAADNCCALQIVGDSYRIICSKPTARAYKVYYKAGKVHHSVLHPSNTFSPLETLLKKD